MGGRSAYSVLGLDAGADDAAIEQAYRNLIKQFHPDRGGDAARAMEINRAYDELRRDRNLHDPLDFNEADQDTSGGRGAWVLLALLLVCASVFLLFQAAPALNPATNDAPPSNDPAGIGLMDRPMALAAIDQAAREAVRLRQTSDELALAARSRSCHQDLRTRPTLALFDRCAAFDAAVVQLQDRDPLRDRGPFSELAVTGRVRSSAALLSDDAVATDARLERIRRLVDRALSPTPAP